jgi:hypothetical protein
MGQWGMLIVETIARIRREHFVQGKTIKEFARDLRLSTEYGSQGPAVGGDVVFVRAPGATPEAWKMERGAPLGGRVGQGNGSATASAFVSLTFAPGEAYQFRLEP